jgi:chromosome segregation ATPase
MARKDINQCSSPLRKLVRFFMKSRNNWKAKHAEWKKECKKLANQTRAVEKSRDGWRERAEGAEKRARELEREMEDLKSDNRAAKGRRQPTAGRGASPSCVLDPGHGPGAADGSGSGGRFSRL